jgi:hypothetical protein
MENPPDQQDQGEDAAANQLLNLGGGQASSSSSLSHYQSTASFAPFAPISFPGLIATTLTQINKEKAQKEGSLYFRTFLMGVYTKLQPSIPNQYFKSHLLYLLGAGTRPGAFPYTPLKLTEGQLEALEGDSQAQAQLADRRRRTRMTEIENIPEITAKFDSTVAAKLVSVIEVWGTRRLAEGKGLRAGLRWNEVQLKGDPIEILGIILDVYDPEANTSTKDRVAKATQLYYAWRYDTKINLAENLDNLERLAFDVEQAHARARSICPINEQEVVARMIREMGGPYADARRDLRMGITPADPDDQEERLKEPKTYREVTRYMTAWAQGRESSGSTIDGISQIGKSTEQAPKPTSSMVMSILAKLGVDEGGLSTLEPDEIEQLFSLTSLNASDTVNQPPAPKDSKGNSRWKKGRRTVNSGPKGEAKETTTKETPGRDDAKEQEKGMCWSKYKSVCRFGDKCKFKHLTVTAGKAKEMVNSLMTQLTDRSLVGKGDDDAELMLSLTVPDTGSGRESLEERQETEQREWLKSTYETMKAGGIADDETTAFMGRMSDIWRREREQEEIRKLKEESLIMAYHKQDGGGFGEVITRMPDRLADRIANDLYATRDEQPPLDMRKDIAYDSCATVSGVLNRDMVSKWFDQTTTMMTAGGTATSTKRGFITLPGVENSSATIEAVLIDGGINLLAGIALKKLYRKSLPGNGNADNWTTMFTEREAPEPHVLFFTTIGKLDILTMVTGADGEILWDRRGNGSVGKIVGVTIGEKEKSKVSGSEKEPQKEEDSNRANSIEGRLAQLSSKQRGRVTTIQQLAEMLHHPGEIEITARIKKGFDGTSDPPVMADFEVWKQVFGKSLSKLQGKDHARKTPPAAQQYRDPGDLQQEFAAIDILYWGKELYLLMKVVPLDYLQAIRIRNRTFKQVADAILTMIMNLKGKSFIVPVIRGDNEFNPHKQLMETLGCEFQPTAALQHEATAENSVKSTKNACRVIESRLKREWADPKEPDITIPVPQSMRSALMNSSTFSLNMRLVSKGKLKAKSARDIFLGRDYNAKLDGAHPFGTSVAYRSADSDNTDKERVEEGILLGPVGNMTGGIVIWNPATGRELTRQHYFQVPMTPKLRELIKQRGAEEEASRAKYRRAGDDLSESSSSSGEESEETEPAPTSIDTEEQNEMREMRARARRRRVLLPPTNEQEDILREARSQMAKIPQPIKANGPSTSKSREKGAQEGPPVETALSETLESELTLRRRNRAAMMKSKDSALAGLVNFTMELVDDPTHISKEQPLGKVEMIQATMGYAEAKRVMGPKRAREAALEEVRQWITTCVGHPIRKHDLTPRQRSCIINGMMKCSEKKDSSKNIIQDKGRLVVDGSVQVHDSYVTDRDTLYSANISPLAMNMTLAIGASRNMRMATYDFKGAYTKGAKFPGSTVVAKMNREVAEMFCEIDPKFTDFVGDDGCLYLELDKAIYGLIEAAKMWNEEIVEQIKKLGFVQNPYDRGLYSGFWDGHFMILNLHVDDVKAEADCTTDEPFMKLQDALEQVYGVGEVKCKTGTKLDFLGRLIDKSIPGETRVSQLGLIKEIVEQGMDGTPIEGYERYPAEEHLFKMDENSKPLEERRRKIFLSTAMKLQWLAQVSRGDITTAVAYATTRATKATEQDWKRMEHLLRYLNRTREKGTCFRPGESLDLTVYVDASFAQDEGRRSRSGYLIMMGKAPILARSVRQKLVTRSTTESEIVALDDSEPSAMLVENACAIMGIKLKPTIIYEDNQSTITMIKNGASNAERTRHIDVKYFWLHEKIKLGKMILRYIKSEDNTADFFTKSICNPTLFKKFMEEILNWD